MQDFDHPDYKLLRRLGSGGQAFVYLARHRTLEREVAIKVLRPGQDASMARRILQEARLVARLQQQHLVQIYDAGVLADKTPYIVMEFVDGPPLNTWSADRTPSTADTLEVIRQVASALAEAHRAGIIHRDVKPQNILMADGDPNGDLPFCAKLVDFGIARPENSAETAVGMVIGTIGYMAPECYEGLTVPASDVFSLGLLFFRLLSGQRGLRASEIRKHIASGSEELGPWSYHSDLMALIEQMVADDADARPANGDALVAQLEALRPWDRFSALPSHAAHPNHTPSTTEPQTGLSRWLQGAGAAALLSCVLGLGWWAWPDPEPSPEEPGPPAAPAIRGPAEDASAIRTLATDDGGGPDGSTVAIPPAAPSPPPAESTGPPARRAAAPRPDSAARARAAEVEPTPPPVQPDSDASQTKADVAVAAAAPAEPAPGPPEATPVVASMPTGRFSGSLQGRPFAIELTGTADRLQAVLTLTVGARSERHVLVGAATLSGSSWTVSASDDERRWAIRGPITGDQFSGRVTIKDKSRGRFETSREP